MLTTRTLPRRPAQPLYLSGVTNDALEELIGSGPLGLLSTPDTYRAERVRRWTDAGATWGADNGCFNHGDSFDPDRWLAWLDTQPRRGCAFAVCPDVVGDAAATLERSAAYYATVRELGFPVGLVGQDGMSPEDVPWGEIDALFIGGSTEWKLSEESARLMAAARSLGRWVHVGRVNSWKRYRWCAEQGAHSVDGTFLAFGPVKNLPRLLGWLTRWADENGRSLDELEAALPEALAAAAA